MPTPIPIIAASCGVQSTTSSTRVPTTAISERLTTIANSGVEQRQPHRDHAERQEQHERRDEDAEDLPGAALLSRRPVDDVAAERHLDPALAVERQRVVGHRLDLLGVDVAGALAELDLGERDPCRPWRRVRPVRTDRRRRAPRATSRSPPSLLDLRTVARGEHVPVARRRRRRWRCHPTAAGSGP